MVSGRTKLEYRLAWQRTRLKLVGLLTNQRSRSGVWAVTDRGYAAANSTGIEGLWQAYVLQQRRVAAVELPQEVAVSGDQEIEDAWRDQLLKVLKQVPPDPFERLAQRLMREAGFLNVKAVNAC